MAVKKRSSSDKYTVTIYLGRDNNGKIKQHTKGGFIRKKDAEEYERMKRIELKNGVNISKSKMALSKFMDEWFAIKKTNISGTTATGYKNYIDKYIKRYLGHFTLDELSINHIEEFFRFLVTKGKDGIDVGLAPRTCHQIKVILKNALTNANVKGYTLLNPWSEIKIPTVRKKKHTIYSNAELAELIEVSKNEDIHMAVRLAASTGMRRSEVLGLKWSEVDFEKKTIHVKEALLYNGMKKEVICDYITKTASSDRIIKFGDGLLEALKKLKLKYEEEKENQEGFIDSNLVCSYSNGRYFNPGRFSHKFSSIISKNNLRAITFHQLRHTHATLLIQNNMDIKIVSDRLGHSSVRITYDLYVHPTVDDQIEIAKMTDFK